jgi:hypothetical protein
MTTINAVDVNLSGQTGTGTFVGSTLPTITTPVLVAYTNGSLATSGDVGFIVDSGVQGSISYVSSATNKNITSISLPAGDWDVYASAFITGTATTTSFIAGISATSVVLPNAGDTAFCSFSIGAQFFYSGFMSTFEQLSATTTIFLVSQATYTGTSPTVSCRLWARIRR